MNTNVKIKLYDIKKKKIYLPKLNLFSNLIIFLTVTILLFSFIIFKRSKIKKMKIIVTGTAGFIGFICQINY